MTASMLKRADDSHAPSRQAGSNPAPPNCFAVRMTPLNISLWRIRDGSAAKGADALRFPLATLLSHSLWWTVTAPENVRLGVLGYGCSYPRG